MDMEGTSTVSNQTPLVEPEILEAIYTSEDEDLYSLSKKQPVMLVFLRHFGCTFCREALSDLSKLRDDLEKRNVRLVLVHMSEDDLATRYFKKYDLVPVDHISDPDLSLYDLFGLNKGSFGQLFGLKVIRRTLTAGVLAGHGLGAPHGNPNQMPGVFVLKNGSIQRKFMHSSAADRPDYLRLLGNIESASER